MQFAYHHNAMLGSRASDARALGSLGGAHTLAQPTLPVPGAPEVMAGMGDCGCGCKGTGRCGQSMSGIADVPNIIGAAVRGAFQGDPTSIALTAGGAYLLYRVFFKKKRR